MPLQQWSDKIWVVQVSRDPAFTEDMETLFGALSSRKDMPDIVVDLAQVEFMNSSNLSQLLKLRKKLVDTGAKLRVAGPPNQVWALFLATGLDKVFQFAPDTMMALADLQITGEARESR